MRHGRKSKKKYGWLNVLGCIIAVFCILTVFLKVRTNRMIERESEMIPWNTDYPLHEYDWNKLEWNGDLLSYEDDRYTSRQGIDVSAHQEYIDWEQVKEAGVDFAFIRVGYRGYQYGYVNNDDYFEYNIRSAQENGIDVGIYFFSQAVTLEEAMEEAQYVVRKLKGYEIQLPVVFDMEEAGDDGTYGRTAELSIEQKTQMAVTFLRHIENAGYTPMIYNSSLLFEKLFDLDYLQDFEFWVADYDTYPKYSYEFSVWQYTSSGHLDGIDGRVDMDIMFVEKEQEAQ